jgi:hypothetical protein
MRRAIIEKNIVVNVIDAPNEWRDGVICENTVAIGDSYIEGVFAKPSQTQDSQATVILKLTNAIQNHLDAKARERRYDGILSLCTYANSTDLIFKLEGQAGVAWRDACWQKSYDIMVDVQANLRNTPTPCEIITEFPEIVWPT